jgi:hypothetical protein
MKSFIGNLFVFVLLCNLSAAQNHDAVNQYNIIADLKQHINVLAHDSLEGRLAGSANEMKAARYIMNQMSMQKLLAKGTAGYLQAFPFKRIKFTHSQQVYFSVENGPKTFSYAHPGGTEWSSSEPIYPMSYSGEQVPTKSYKITWAGYGIGDRTLNHDDYQRYNLGAASGNVWVMWYRLPDGDNPHSRYAELWGAQARVDSAIKRGAAGVIFLADPKDDVPLPKSYTNPEKCKSIPVWMMKENIDTHFFNGASFFAEVKFQNVSNNANNVIGYIDNKAAKTIIIGAHYDHLGFDEYGHSTLKLKSSEAKQIYNGADDNASGTAALLVLAKVLKQKKYSKLNYLFIAFSGEEDGLLGSNYFTRNPTIELSKVLAMLNMDMIGRLDPAKYTLGINGTGTAKEWDALLSKITIDSLKYKYTTSGTGASDHTSFYNVNIPVLHYFTGTHSDYHKPSDDEDKINYDGAAKTITHMAELIKLLNDKPELTFQKTAADSTTRVVFKVTLGIMPDYMYEGKGVRVDGVTEGKPAANAGIQRDDILLSIGEYKTENMQQYMQALSKFKKGDEAPVEVLRKGKTLSVKVLF